MPAHSAAADGSPEVMGGGDNPARDGAGLVADFLGGEVTAEGMEIVPMRPDTAVFDAIVRLTGTSGYARVRDVLADVVHVGVDRDHGRGRGVELRDGGNWVRARTIGLDGDPGGGVGDIGCRGGSREWPSPLARARIGRERRWPC